MKEHIKKILSTTTGYTIAKVQRKSIQQEEQIDIIDFLDLYFSYIDPEDFFFIEMGANDGKTNDPLYPYIVKHGLRGVVVEPQPDVYDLLVETYKDQPQVTCVHGAIAEETGVRPFYTAKESVKTTENYSRVTGLGTLNRDVLVKTLKNKLPKGTDVSTCIQVSNIEAITFDDLCTRLSVKRVDYIQSDCEGYDYEILRTIDLKKHTPKIINFESGHLSDQDRKACEGMLENAGYQWFRHGIDTCAYRIHP